jgi:hypothetical protein
MCVSLNIGSGTIRVLSLKGKHVKKWGSLALQDGLVKDGIVREPDAVGKAIGALFRSTGLPRDRVTVGLSGLSFTYRFLRLPCLKSSWREEAVLRAAGREMSLPLDELYLSWRALPGLGEEQTFFVLGVPKRPVDAVLEALGAAGIKAEGMDLRPLALARAAARAEAIVVNLDADCFDIAFIAGGFVRLVHTISPRSREATLEDNVRQVADELGKMTAFYQSSRPEAPLSTDTPVLLSGDLAGDSPAAALLQAEVDYPVSPLVPPVEAPPGFPAASFAASAGLALKPAPPPKDRRGTCRFDDLNVDILAGKRRRDRTRRPPAAYILLGVVMTVTAVMLIPLYQASAALTTANAARQEDLREIKREIDLAGVAAAADSKTEAEIRAVTANTTAWLVANREILSTRGAFSDIVSVVTGALPARAVLTSIQCDSRRIAVSGQAPGVFTAVDYAAALEATGRFSDVRITRLDEGGAVPAAAENASAAPPGSIIFDVLLAH